MLAVTIAGIAAVLWIAFNIAISAWAILTLYQHHRLLRAVNYLRLRQRRRLIKTVVTNLAVKPVSKAKEKEIVEELAELKEELETVIPSEDKINNLKPVRKVVRHSSSTLNGGLDQSSKIASAIIDNLLGKK